MKKGKLICGIDISKRTLDICFNENGKLKKGKFLNTPDGHTKLQQLVGNDYTYVMESTGTYGLKLCYTLKQQGIDVRVENPTVIKRYIQMNRGRNKSDAKDAKAIYQYGIEHEAKIWHAPTKEVFQCIQLLSAIDVYIREKVTLINYKKSLSGYPIISTVIVNSLTKKITTIENDIEKLEERLQKKLVQQYGALRDNLLSIPGIGKRCVAYLIILTNGFKTFTNYRQVIAFAGTAPREYSSGTMELKKKIDKMGNAKLRKNLYMGSMCALLRNKKCKELYDRLKAKGKPGKLAMIAVCNKMLKQAFAIAKTGVPYDENHISILKKPITSIH